MLVEYKGQQVEPKGFPYEFSSFDKNLPTLAEIWHITNPTDNIEISGDFGESHIRRTLRYNRLLIAMNNSIEWTKQYNGLPLEHTVRILRYSNSFDKVKQCMPLHHDFCVHTTPLLDISDYLNVEHENEVHHGVLSNDFDRDRDLHAAYCWPKSQRVYAVLFSYPGEAYKNIPMNQVHSRNVQKSKHNVLFDRDDYYTLTFGRYYETIMENARWKA